MYKKILTLLLAVTASAIVGVMMIPSLGYFVMKAYAPLMIGQLILVFVLSARIHKMSYMTAKLMFTVYSFTTGLFLSFIMYVYDFWSIAFALGTTIVVFTVMSIYGLTTKEDLSKFSNIFKTALISLIIVSLINMFLRSASLYWIISYAGVIIFTGLIGFDMQRIKHMMYEVSEYDGELTGKLSIMGALTLYLDFINLFIYLLRIFGKRR
jgi:hypothetical protein